jgi:hypothetical protein
MPGVLRCDQNQPNCTNGSDGHADKAQQFALGTYNLYLDKHGRNGIDNNNMPILSSVHYQPDSASAYGNAFWSGTQMVYGDAYGFTNADDVVAHELTHGVTQYESNLYYFYQSGAISESLSDVFGEYYDQTNGLGNDLPEVKWLLGEDVTGASPIRSLSNPPLYGDPDKMTSALYNKKSAIQNGFDEGGVHSNSGVNNKAVYLMVDGGAFNYKTITALGWDKTAAIYYEVQTNLLSSGSDYSDLYYAVQQACANLSLTNFKGITLADCVQVKNALDAVEMSKQPAANFHVDATLCPAGSSTGVATTLFSDNFENGVDKWSISLPWKLDNSYSSSSTHSIWGDDAPTSYYSGMSMKVKLPEGTSYLYFKHAFGFEYYNNYYYDGGMIEYTADNGASFHDIKPLFSAGKNYTGVILNHPQSQNPLKGYAGFVGDSHGYTSSRYNLTPLAGKDVTFIWGMGTDQKYSYIGWHIDDVSVYTCVGSSSIPALTTPANNTLVNEYKPLLDWTDVTTNFHHYQVQVATDSAFTTASLVSDENNIITSQYAIPTNLNLNTPYYWRVRSFNAVDETKGWSPVWKFTTGDVPATFNMQSPFNNSTNQPTILTLKWSKSDGITPAAYYEYCYALTKNSACTSWRNVGLNTSADLRGLLPEKTYYWQVRAFNFFGQTQANSSTWNSFTTGQTKTGNYYSQSANDGWTLESSETSNLASTKSNSGKLRVGDDIRNKQYRSLLYFDTASIPDKAVISKVTLKIHKASVIGTDPITSHGDLIADMKKGFFGLSPLELTDFNVAAGLVNIGKFTLIGGDWYQLTLSPLNLNYINLIGATQFRIRFVLDDNNNKIANIALFDSGGDANQPQLIIEYTAP